MQTSLKYGNASPENVGNRKFLYLHTEPSLYDLDVAIPSSNILKQIISK